MDKNDTLVVTIIKESTKNTLAFQIQEFSQFELREVLLGVISGTDIEQAIKLVHKAHQLGFPKGGLK
jgi:organic hydroperoxide reductase OsmC/OhrA